jgi:hypothetical protein
MEKNKVVVGAVVLALVAAGFFVARAKSGALGGDRSEESAEKGSKRGDKRRGAGDGTPEEGAREGAVLGAAEKTPPPNPSPDSYEYGLMVARNELAMAKQDLDNYRQTSRWPESARPAEEMEVGGGLLPHYTPPVTLRLVRKNGDGTVDQNAALKSSVTLKADRAMVIGDEAVNVLISGADASGKDAPVRCVYAKAFAVADKPMAPMDLPCDPAEEDNVRSKFVPLTSPFRNFVGTIRLEYSLAVTQPDGTSELGGAELSIFYGGAEVARFNGQVREAYENGSIAYYLGFDVLKPGFYRLNVRADSGRDDKVFANINVRQNVDKPGPTELRAELFGKLVKDSQAKVVRLRDMDGEFVGVDGVTASIKGRDGVFFTGKTVDATQVSGDEWRSPERDAKLAGYEATVKQAQENCDKNFNGCGAK